ncbi:MAG TPA: PPOX class F420-dependent oxidoreductase [Acidimicrobiales bacterium]|nr:PPOX class F420-dependent oxidoreductase [Acidimicrobiales bacterium]
MDVGEALEFVRHNHRAVMATTRADGRPALTPVAAAVDDDGKVVVSTRETAMKAAHLRRAPYASILVMNDGFFGSWAQLEGPVEIVALPDAMEGLVAYYRSVAGEHPDWDAYRAAMASERRVLLRMTVERAGPSRSG